jgi:sugar O-acyltransferase (sialic acid O-acetyltransferase NeuD family)
LIFFLEMGDNVDMPDADALPQDVANAESGEYPVLLVGGGGHCRSVIEILEQCRMPVAGIVHGIDCAFEPVSSFPPLGRDADLPVLRARYANALVTVGQIRTPRIRRELFSLLETLGFEFPIPVSPSAWVSPRAALGRGTIVMHNAIVNTGSKVGKNCIINNKALVEHDCIVENHCHIAAGATLCGGVFVGEGSFIGAHAVVREGARIGKRCIVGMGARVYRDIQDGERCVG